MATIGNNIKASQQEILVIRHMPVSRWLGPAKYLNLFVLCEADVAYGYVLVVDVIVE